MRVKYAAPYLDYSGYGQASRHHVGALDAAGVDVVGELLSYSTEKADYGKLGSLMHKVSENGGDYKIKLLHTTPDEFKRYVEPGKYHVGFMYWETDKIPRVFAEGLSYVDEIWTGSQANFDAIRKAGVTKPIKIIPQAIDVSIDWPKPYENESFDSFTFYSIFEWTDRKNPEALIRAYLEEFDREDVGLLVKTYFRNFSYSNKKMIRNKMQMIKDSLNLKKAPPIYLYLDLMDNHQILRTHATGDCFVSTHRGEGWGLPQTEAMLAGNPIISTNYGGVHEYLDENSYLLPYKMKKLSGMRHSRFYSDDQSWADVDIKEVKKAMRHVFDNQDLAMKKGDNASKYVHERFNFKRVGSEMRDRLQAIEATL